MSIKSDRWILAMCEHHQLITPYESSLVREVVNDPNGIDLSSSIDQIIEQVLPGITASLPRRTRKIISVGLSSYGYDLRLAPDGFRVFSPIASAEIDPKNFDERSLIEAPLRTAEDGSQYWLLPPHSYALGVTVETFNIPRSVMMIVLGKSTYARCGLIVNATPGEPGWKGRLVLEFSNSASVPLRVYAEEGCAQAIFFEADEECEVSYADRNGKYQAQIGLTTAKF